MLYSQKGDKDNVIVWGILQHIYAVWRELVIILGESKKDGSKSGTEACQAKTPKVFYECEEKIAVQRKGTPRA